VRPKASDNYVNFSIPRLRFFYGLLLVVFVIFLVRLFYLQIIRHDFYEKSALAGQFKEYQIPAERGVILARDGNNEVPIVLNEQVFTVFADPKFITDPKSAAEKVSLVIGGDVGTYEKLMKEKTRYSVLAKKINKDNAKKVDELNIKGLGTRAVSQRVYPQGSLGSQLLGFVDDEGSGKYGVEQFLDDELKGKAGELRAITDAQGVPLVSNGDNVLVEPKNGERISLTIDISMQRRVEDLLKTHLEQVKSKAGSVLIIDPYSGELKAMANFPTYNPAEFSKVEDPKLFTNSVVSEPLEVGSIMKTLTVAAGLDSGAVGVNTSYYDPGAYRIGDATVRNVEEDGGAATRSVPDILRYSLNTGATYILMQMGGGEINESARVKWHDYLINHFMFGKQTGIEQGYEAEGFVQSPTDGFGLNIQYANMAFGQGINVTPVQMAAAFSATINGGTYYKPHLVKAEKETKVVKEKVIDPGLSPVLRGMHENSVAKNYTFLQRSSGFKVGGKTGTAEIPKPGGGYFDDKYNGTFIGYVGGEKPEYVIMVTVIEPKVDGYAGRAAAAPMFGKVVDMLIGNYPINRLNQ
jgi:cell division protein FtsI/penicillin-binding protein 2